ncbi:MAG: exosortase, partial [Marinomonas sp.]
GPRLTAYLLLPIGMMCFLVPFGDEVIPFLQSITAEIAIALTKLSGVEAVYEDIYIHTPVGLFIVAEECSGVKFLVAMVTLGVLVAFTSFSTWKRRALFMAACVLVPIIANGIRAWGTIFIAQSQGVEFAAGFDHIIYGWVFFAIVMALVLGGAFRFFDREPDDAGYSAEELSQMGWLSALEARAGNANAALLAAGALIIAFALAAIYASAPTV